MQLLHGRKHRHLWAVISSGDSKSIGWFPNPSVCLPVMGLCDRSIPLFNSLPHHYSMRFLFILSLLHICLSPLFPFLSPSAGEVSFYLRRHNATTRFVLSFLTFLVNSGSFP